MATYKEIKGLTVQNLSADPSLGSGNEGQVWFNSTTGKLKSLVQIGAWASVADVTTLRSHCGGAGTQTAGLIFGGVPYTGVTEEFNGAGWATQSGALNTARGSMGSLGTSTAALYMGGDTAPTYVKVVEEYNGTVWSEEADIPTAITDICGVGIQTAGLACGGNSPIKDTVNLYNGSAWTAETAMPTTRDEAAGSGTSTAALVAGGHSPGGTTNATTTIEYDGTTWTDGGALTAAQAAAGCSKAGTQTAAIIFGGMTGPGTPSVVTTTAQYDGTAWTATGSMGAAKRYLGCGGSSTAAFAACGMGAPPTKTTTAETFEQSLNVTTAAAWSSGGDMSRSPATYAMGGCGTQTAALAYSGQPGSVLTTESYNGTAWTAVNSLNTGRPADYNNNVGNQGAALQVGCSPSWGGEVESWDGTNWTVNPASITGRGYACSFGSQTAALCAGGYSAPGGQTIVEDWNGTTWTEVGDLGSSLYGRGGCGTPSAAVVEGGAPGVNTTVESWNGTAWTAGTAFPTANNRGNMSGIQTDGISIGGQTPGGGMTQCNQYDGTSWITCPSLATARYGSGTGGTTGSNSLVFGGDTPPGTVATEEFTAATGTVTASNITSS